MMKALISAICLFAAVAISFPQEKDALSGGGDLLNITYLNDPLPEKWLKRLEQMLDYELDFYKKLGLEKEFAVKVHAFKDRDRGYAYMDSRYGQLKWQSESGVKTSGIFLPSENVIGIFGFGKDMDRTIGLLSHEISHGFFSQVYPRRHKTVPTWLNEGLAEYFQHCTVKRNGELVHEFPEDDRGRLKTRYMLGEMDVTGFLDYDRSRFMRMEHIDDMSAYRIAHAIVSFMVDEARDDYFVRFFSMIKDMSAAVSPSIVVEATYPGGIKSFEKDFRSYILQ